MKRLEQIIIGCLTFMLVACQQNEVVAPLEEAVELTLKLGVLDNASRGNVTDYPYNTANWSSAEKLVDGRFLYKVSVYLVDTQGKVVACKDKMVDNQATEVIVEFEKSPNLKRGIYTLMAVANHGDYTMNGITYVSGLKADWGTIGVGSEDDMLLGKKISSSMDNISPKDVVQPLSLMKEIELHAGSNMVEGELVRTFARLRIEVKNNSSNAPLKINGLTFSSNFAQKEAYVFHDGQNDRYLASKGVPVSTSPDALQPLTPDADESFMTIGTQQSAVVFDSYLLESKVTEAEEYKYTLDLAYEGVKANVDTYKTNGTTIKKASSLKINNESYFLIYNEKSKRFLSANGNTATNATFTLSNDVVLSKDNVWKIENNTSSYSLKNVGNGLYLQSPTSSGIGLSETKANYSFTGDSNIRINGGNYYVAVKADKAYGNQNYNADDVKFTFYEVVKTTASQTSQTIKYDTPITLTTIDPITQQSSPTTAIKRNDFINVLITVSYNPVAGNLEFEVANWSPGGGNVEFD